MDPTKSLLYKPWICTAERLIKGWGWVIITFIKQNANECVSWLWVSLEMAHIWKIRREIESFYIKKSLFETQVLKFFLGIFMSSWKCGVGLSDKVFFLHLKKKRVCVFFSSR